MAYTDSEFSKALQNFVDAAQAKVDAYYSQYTYPNAGAKLRVKPGTRYIRIVKIENGHDNGSAFCFVDSTNGDVLKAAGWKTPAKGMRSNIFSEDFGASGVTPYGAVYRTKRGG